MILVICPVYNEQNNILPFVSRILRYVNSKVNFLFMEDNSEDLTRKICRYISENLPFSLRNKIFFVFNESNLGYGENLLKGFSFALERSYEVILTIDCDFQHLPSYLPLFFSLSKKYDFVTGTRYSYNSALLSERNFYRYMINRKLVSFLKSFYGISVSDFFCGFRSYRKRLLENIFDNLMKFKGLTNINFSYDLPIYLWVEILNFTLNIKEIPIPFIFFEDRIFKGFGSEVLRSHYDRLKIYIDSFVKYYSMRR